MRKVNLTMDENEKYKIIKKLCDTNGNKTRASIKLGCTVRHVNRLIQKYKKEGKEAFRHKNRGKSPANAFSEAFKVEVLLLYENKYYNANIRHFTELLNENEGINISESSVRNVFKSIDLLSPCCHKKTRNALNKKLRNLQKQAKTKKKKDEIQIKIMEVENPHPRREKCRYFGEMEQADASVYNWFGSINTYLHASIDDATGIITGAYFDYEETLNGYYKMFKNMLLDHGIPYMFYTDRRTIFEYKKLNTNDLEKDTYTQFAYACKQLGVEIKSTSVSQAKGKVERLFRSLQSRLPIELRLAGVTTIDEANAFLQTYIKKYNERFALPKDCTKSVFDTDIDEEKINLTLAVICDRKIDSGHCLKYKNEYYKLVDSKGIQRYFSKGKTVNIIKTLNNKLYANLEGKTYCLDKIEKHVSEKTKPKPRKRYIPPMEHPWKRASFIRYKKQLGTKVA